MLDRQYLAHALRFLAIDAINTANSGHPGAPMGMADMAETLWRHHLKHNPSNPQWVDRDRFVLSNGHASMLLYGLLHLTGYDVSIDDIKDFRKLKSITAGHPEYGHTPGVECTTGPLGQGIAMAVGMALAERHMAAQFNKEGHVVVDHHTYVFLGDGCMMEGISHEACSLAGTLGLGKLIALYDANGISIDGKIEGWFSEDVAARYEAYGWHVIRNVDGHDAGALDRAIFAAKDEENKPTLIICHTHIGYGSPKQDSASCHGSPLGAEGRSEAAKKMGWDHMPFAIPQDVMDAWNGKDRGIVAQSAWNTRFAAYAEAYPDLAQEFLRRMHGDLPSNWDEIVAEAMSACLAAKENIATRVASLRALEAFLPSLPELMGGSADLTGSVGTKTSKSTVVDCEHYENNHIYYGVREFAMGAMMNGMVLHGGIVPYAGTFMMFSDYAKNAIRLSALMQKRVLWVLTHDSIGVGEDGPTHQPVEQVAGLRLTPGLHVWRPCDTVETLVAWKCGLEEKKVPQCLSLSRQNLPFIERSEEQQANIAKGGYILRDCDGTPQLIILATGSEVALALEAAKVLSDEGKKVRVVSMPCTELFDAQKEKYRESVLPKDVRARLAVEAGAADYWYKYVGLDGRIVGMTSFGASAPGDVLAKHFGFTVENVVAKAKEIVR